MGLYVGGMDLASLIQRAQASEGDDTRWMAEILRRFEPLARKIASSLTKCPHLRQDLANAARIGLVKAVRAHRVGREGFPGYARAFMVGSAKREAKVLTEKCVLAGDEAVVSIMERSPATSSRETSSVGSFGQLQARVAAMMYRQRRLVWDRYAMNCAVGEIAANRGVSSAAVSQQLSVIHRKLRHDLLAGK